MDKYTIHCTPEQTKKALELGAPIEFEVECPVDFETWERSPYPDIKMGKDGEPILIIPTAEQMIGWLDENELCIETSCGRNSYDWDVWEKPTKDNTYFTHLGGLSAPTRKESILAAIDVALDYLIKNKK